MYLNFYFFFIFEVDKSGALAPTYPPSKRKSDLSSSFKRGKSSDSFYLEGDHVKALDLKIYHFYLVRKTEILSFQILFSDFFADKLDFES